MKKVNFLILLTTAFYNSFSQTSVVLQPDASTGKDAVVTINDVSGANGNSNFGTDVDFHAARFQTASDWNKSRSLIQFDLSSIPSKAIITSATLTFYGINHINTGQANTSTLSRISSSWDEGGVTWNNQPATYKTKEIAFSNSTSATQNYSVDVKAHVQEMISIPASNFGWMIKLNGEASNLAAQLNFASSDYSSDPAKRPKLEITYFLLSFSVAETSTPTATDGAISLTVSGGTTPYSFLWSNSATTQNISGLGKGYYEVTVTDAAANSAKAYVIVGSLNSSSTVSIQPGPDFGIDAAIMKKDASDTYGYANYGTFGEFRAQRWTSGGWYKERAVLRYDLSSIPSNAVVTSATLTLYGLNHSTLQQSNASTFMRITEPWDELMVTFDKQPATTTAGQISLAQSSSATQNYTLDVASHIQDMINNPQSNYGWLLKMNGESNSLYGRLIFASSDYTVDINKRPMLSISFYVPEEQHAVLKKSLDGGYYTTRNNALYFKYNEEYQDTDGYLKYSVYDFDRTEVISNSTVSKAIVHGTNEIKLDVSSLASGYYVLEVKNEKNEIWKLRFKK